MKHFYIIISILTFTHLTACASEVGNKSCSEEEQKLVSPATCGYVDIELPTLCSAEENVIASCGYIGQQKQVMSICGQGLSGDDSGFIEYRFGKEGNIEERHRFTKASGQKIYRGVDGNYNVNFLFSRDNFSYLVTFPQEMLGSTITVDIKNLTTKNTRHLSCTKNVAYWGGEKNMKTSILKEWNGDDIFRMFSSDNPTSEIK